MTRITLLNYADRNFRSAQRLNSLTGKRVGKFDRVLSYGPADIDADFRVRNRELLAEPKGGGYWLWKPYFIERSLATMPDGEWLFYCDAGSYFLTSVRPMVDYFTPQDLDIVSFEDQHPEHCMTKRAVFETLGATDYIMGRSNQRLAGFILFRSSPRSRAFVRRWLQMCQVPGLINDELAPGSGEVPDFVAHRHDGSIYSLLSKLAGLPAHRDPSQFGNPVKQKYANSPYNQLVQLTRRRDVPLRKLIKSRVYRWAKMLGWRGNAAVPWGHANGRIPFAPDPPAQVECAYGRRLPQ